MSKYRIEAEFKIGIPAVVTGDGLVEAVSRADEVITQILSRMLDGCGVLIAEESARLIKIEKVSDAKIKRADRIAQIVEQAKADQLAGKEKLMEKLAGVDRVVRKIWGMSLSFCDIIVPEHRHYISMKKMLAGIEEVEYWKAVLERFSEVLEMVSGCSDVVLEVWESETEVRIIFNDDIRKIIKKILSIRP